MKISLFQVGSRKMKDRWGELRLEFRKRLSRLCGVKGVIHASITRVGGKPSHVRLRHDFLQMHTAEMCHWRGNMVEARVPRALSSIRYDTLTFLRCRMRKTMAAASWINDTDPGRWGRPSVNFLRSSEPP